MTTYTWPSGIVTSSADSSRIGAKTHTAGILPFILSAKNHVMAPARKSTSLKRDPCARARALPCAVMKSTMASIWASENSGGVNPASSGSSPTLGLACRFVLGGELLVVLDGVAQHIVVEDVQPAEGLELKELG